MNQIDIDILLKTIGLNLRVIRTAHNETLEGVATAINSTHSTLSHIENGNYKSLKLEQIVDLCNYYEVPLQQVLGLEMIQLFHFTQKNDNGGAHTMENAGLQGTFNDLADGYKTFIDHLKDEIAELKKQIGKPDGN